MSKAAVNVRGLCSSARVVYVWSLRAGNLYDRLMRRPTARTRLAAVHASLTFSLMAFPSRNAVRATSGKLVALEGWRDCWRWHCTGRCTGMTLTKTLENPKTRHKITCCATSLRCPESSGGSGDVNRL